MTPAVRELINEYKKIKPEIEKRLEEFAPIHKASDEKIFREMCFCLLTANANALRCDTAIKELDDKNLLLVGSSRMIRPCLRGRVRFHNKKADFITGARRLFKDGGKFCVKGKLDFNDVLKVREWLVDNVKGLGFKEASHFLRNIGLGRDIAILDRHILKNLKKYGVINTIPSSPGSRRIYLDIEEKMKAFSKMTGIPLADLDLLFWSMQTGFVFK